MLVTESGITKLSRSAIPAKAASPMLVTLPSVGITLLAMPYIKVLLSVSIKQLFAE